VPPTTRPIGAVASVDVDGIVLRRAVGDASYLSQHGATLHYGLGGAERVDRIVVQWRPGSVDEFEGLDANRLWLLSEGDPNAVALEPRVDGAAGASALSNERKRVAEFWRLQRLAMRAMKVDGDVEAAIPLFRQALALNPSHEDSIYYFGNCLAARGDVGAALTQFERLRTVNPRSHRAHKRWGTLRAISASNVAELDAAADALEAALEINQEATGALALLAEIALMKGDRPLAQRRFELVSQTNPRAVSALFLLAYLAWSSDDAERTGDLVDRARSAISDESVPQGAASEGDVRRRMHTDRTLFSRFVDAWDPTERPEEAFAPLDSFLRHADFM
jgi:tetratricopeptide (TPR) repeat protein